MIERDSSGTKPFAECCIEPAAASLYVNWIDFMT